MTGHRTGLHRSFPLRGYDGGELKMPPDFTGERESPLTKKRKIGSVEIPDLTSLLEIHDEPVFDGYRKGGCSLLGRDGGHEKIPKVSSLCRSGGYQLEDILMDIFSSLPFPAGTANAPKNVMKNDDFYRAAKPGSHGHSL